MCATSTSYTFISGDIPFLTTGIFYYRTMKNAGRLIQAGAEAVKIEECNSEICKQINHLTHHGIPVMGHIGLMPQSVHALGDIVFKEK